MSQQSRAWISQWIGNNLAWTSTTFAKGTVGAAMFIAMGSAIVAADKDPQVAKALSYKPRQLNVNYDQVTEKDIEKCTSQYENKNGAEGLTIYGPEGQVLRRFADVNKDRQVDMWCYFKDGIEVYRDIDSDFNSTADQYRWLGIGGSRWGIDKNEDGKIDSWKSISPEEVTIELVDAIKMKDDDRFRRLLLTEQEIDSLGLGDEKAKALQERVATAKKSFADFLKSQKLITPATRWAHFAADKPGVVPAGTDGATNDLKVYENVISIVDNEGNSQQLMVGTLVQVADTWKLADLPRSIEDGKVVAEGGFFFPSAVNNRAAMVSSGSNGATPEIQNYLADLEKVDSEIKSSGSSGKELGSLHAERAKILSSLVTATKNSSEMELWVRQFVDSVSSAAMQGEFPDGLDRLKEFESALSNMKGGTELTPYVAYRVITTAYQVRSMEDGVNFAKLQEDHLSNLEAYAERYTDSPDAADAMVQIALNKELSGNEADAKTWYSKVAKKFPATTEGKKASGALDRLSLAGRPFDLTGQTLDGKVIRLSEMPRTPIVVHYWASWCEPCKNDMEVLRRTLAKSPKGFQVVGVNLDTDATVATKSLKPGAAPWPHIHQKEGFDSKLAVGLGVLSVPVTILIDAKGRVVQCSSHFSNEMEAALDELLQGPPAANGQTPPRGEQLQKSNPTGPSAQQQPPKQPLRAPNTPPGTPKNASNPGKPAK